MIEIWTDGSCNYKLQKGGVGCYIKRGESEIFFQKGYYGTTISRMELRAIIHAFQLIEDKIGVDIIVYCDSEYTVNSINYGWVWQWEEDCWISRKNADLWTRFLDEYRKFFGGHIQFKWCKSHADLYGNEVADILADYKNQEIWDEDIRD